MRASLGLLKGRGHLWRPVSSLIDPGQCKGFLSISEVPVVAGLVAGIYTRDLVLPHRLAGLKQLK